MDKRDKAVSKEFSPLDLILENRALKEQIFDLREALKQFVAVCETAAPSSFVGEIGIACTAAKMALARQRGGDAT